MRGEPLESTDEQSQMLVQPSCGTRRAFARDSILAAIGAATFSATLSGDSSSRLSAAPADDAGWIDAHVHVWHPDLTRYPISERFTQADMQPPSFTAQELLDQCRPAGVKRVVLIQMSFYEYDHRYLREVMQGYPGVFAGVGLIDFADEHLLERIERLAEWGVRGFRLHATTGTEQWVNHPGMKTLWTRAGELGLAICPLINPDDLENVEKLCQRFPETTVVVDHFARIGIHGTIDQTRLDRLCGLAKLPNTYVKTSAFYALGNKRAPYDDLIPMIRRVYDSFGPQRLMWGSDCPYQVQGEHSYRASLALIADRIDFLSPTDKSWILRGTAEKVFFE